MKKRQISLATTARRRRQLAGWLCALAGIALIFVAAGTRILRVNAQSTASQDATSTAPGSASQQNMATTQAPAANPPGQPAASPGPPVIQATAGAAIDQQKQGVAGEAADLLKMATALKSEVDKTTKDTLSVTVVRKAGEIEQLAHKVRVGPGKG